MALQPFDSQRGGSQRMGRKSDTPEERGTARESARRLSPVNRYPLRTESRMEAANVNTFGATTGFL